MGKKKNKGAKPDNIDQVYGLVVYAVKKNGWCDGFVLCGNKNLTMKNLSVRKSDYCVHLDFDVVFETKKTRIYKEVRARYDMKNYGNIKSDISSFYGELERQAVFVGDKVYLNEFNALGLEKKGWFRQY